MTPRHTEVTDHDAEEPARDCSAMRQVLDRVGDRWSMLIVTVLNAGPRRFNQLRRDLPGVSQRMLTLSLRHLERDGLVVRTVFDGAPVQVEYALSALGRSFSAVIDCVLDWADRHSVEMDDARAAYATRMAPETPASA